MARPTTRDTNLTPQNLGAYLAAQENKSLLRFITCGSVDDGKSTLIGRLLYESHLLFDDQLAALTQESKKFGTQGGEIDFALLVDGLAAEREQGITIDVAYRYFSTDKRKFICADTPGHEQYTRNMATAASTAELAILLVDAREGVVEQTRRHAFIASLLGVRSIVLAVNKMDLIDYNETEFNKIKNSFAEFSAELDFTNITAIPLSALRGDNITEHSDNMDWYDGLALLPHLEQVAIEDDDKTLTESLRLPVQNVLRPSADFRGFSGTIAAGVARAGEAVQIISNKETDGNTKTTNQTTQIKEIFTPKGKAEEAGVGEAVTITLADEIDVSRGSFISDKEIPAPADQFEAHILWLGDEALLPGRAYIFKCANQSAVAKINPPKHKININTLEDLPARTLELNEIGLASLSLNNKISFAPYAENRALGSFILIDRITNRTVGAGMLRFALHRASNIVWQDLEIDAAAHAAQKNQRPAVLWFTGLSGSGKSTIANLLQKKLYAADQHSIILDGDNLRHGLNRDLGFSDADRVENIRRAGEVARLMLEAGLFPLVSFISPFAAERRLARELVEEDQFIEIFIDTPLDIAEERDVKGLYKKARAGEIKNFTGLDSPYEPPENPELVIDTTAQDATTAANIIYDYLVEHKYIK